MIAKLFKSHLNVKLVYYKEMYSGYFVRIVSCNCNLLFKGLENDLINSS